MQASGDEMHEDDTATISPRLLPMAFVTLGSLVFVLLGAWLVIWHWRDPKALVIGIAAVAFFGWCAAVGFRRLRSNWKMSIGPEGLTIPGPTFKPKLIRWDDVEAFTAFNVGASAFTGIKLRNASNLIAQYSTDEANALLRRNKVFGVLDRAAAPMGAAAYVGQSAVDSAIVATNHSGDLSDYFAGRRAAYGCEITLTALDRDRGAPEFANYLESMRQKYSKPTVVTEFAHA